MQKMTEIPKPDNTPIKELGGLFGVRSLFMKDETQNRTHTFKDRLAYEMLRPTLESIQAGEEPKHLTFGSISYGNTAYSMGVFCELLNEAHGSEIVRGVAFVPPSLVDKPFGPDSRGVSVPAQNVLEKIESVCTVVDIDLEEKTWREDDLRELAEDTKVLLGDFIDITEGLDRPAYVNIIIEAIEIQLERAPDYVIVPFGAGILCNEIIDYIQDNNLDTKVVAVSSGDPNTIAIMLYGPIWVDTKALLADGMGMTRHDVIDRKGRERAPYPVYHVSDEEIRAAMDILRDNQIVASASGASGFALLPRLGEIHPAFDREKDSVLVINTGDGLLNF